MHPYPCPPRYLLQHRQQSLELRAPRYRHFVYQRRYQIIRILHRLADRCQVFFVLSCGTWVSVFNAVECPSYGFSFCLFSNKFVISHSFLLYAASMPNSEPANVATSPNPTNRLSCISPCGYIYTPQNSIASPPTARTAAVIICKLYFIILQWAITNGQ